MHVWWRTSKRSDRPHFHRPRSCNVSKALLSGRMGSHRDIYGGQAYVEMLANVTTQKREQADRPRRSFQYAAG